LIRRGLYRLRLWFGEDAIAPGAVEGDCGARSISGQVLPIDNDRQRA
jgi:hypothetical protein